MENDRFRRNLQLLNISAFTRTFLIIMPVFVPLMQSYGLNLKETMLLQSAFALVALLLEIPSGYLADVFGRKRMLMIGSFMAGVGFTQLLWADTFWQLVGFEASLGVALSFMSGSDTALAYESEAALNEPQSQQAIARLLSWMNFGEGAAALLAFVLLRYGYDALIWVQVAVGWVAFFASFGLFEPPRQRSVGQPAKANVRAIQQAFFQNPLVPLLTLLFVGTMSVTYLNAWLNQSLWLDHGLPLAYFGLVWGLFGLTVGLSARFSGRLPERMAGLPTLSLLAVPMALGLMTLASGQLHLIILGGVLMATFRGLFAPRIKVLINNAVDNRFRATVNSITALSFRLATLGLGPLMGAIVDRHGSQAGIVSISVFAIPALIALLLAGYRLPPHARPVTES